MRIPKTHKEAVTSFLILHDIRSSANVGSLFRTADAAGISKIFLTGYTPAPRDKFQRVNKDIAKTALGAENMVLWEKKSSLTSLITRLKKEEVRIVAIEQSEDAVDYKKVKHVNPSAYILGNEVTGISAKLLKQCDVVAEIPMRGEKESLNVSVAGGVAIFRILNV